MFEPYETHEIEEENQSQTSGIGREPVSSKRSKKKSPYKDDVSLKTDSLIKAEQVVFVKEMHDATLSHGYPNETASLVKQVLETPDETIKEKKDVLQEILQSFKKSQTEKELIVEFKGRVIAINNVNAEVTIYEDGRNATYTGLDPSYLIDAGLSEGESFILKIVNDAGLEMPIFLPDKTIIDKRIQEIGPKTEESRRQALESQKDLDELHKFIKHNEPKQ